MALIGWYLDTDWVLLKSYNLNFLFVIQVYNKSLIAATLELCKVKFYDAGLV